MAGTRRTTKSRIELEVSQNEAKNRRQFKRIQQWARETQKTMAGIATAARRIALGIGGFFATTIKLWSKQELAERKLAGALRQTGQDVKRLKNEYKQLASEIQATTTYGDEDLLGAAATLTRLAKISEDQMPRILRLTADWAAFLGKDVTAAARDVGRVMADPVRNLSLMGRYGVQVTDQLKLQITALIHTGQVEAARLLVWQELNDVVGGTSKEIAAVETGKWLQLKNLLGDILEIFGERLLERLKPIRIFLHDLFQRWMENRDAVRSLADWLIRGFIGAISALIATKLVTWLALVVKALYGVRTAAGVAALGFRAMWGAATLGIAFVAPFIIENWDKVTLVFFESIRSIKKWWGGLMDYMAERTRTVFQRQTDALDRMAERVGIKRPGRSRGGGASWGPVPVEDSETPDLPERGKGADPQDSWWQRVKGIWRGEGTGGEAPPDSGLAEEEAGLQTGVPGQAQLDDAVERYKAHLEKLKDVKKTEKDAEREERRLQREEEREARRLELEEKRRLEAAKVQLVQDASNSEIGIIRGLSKAKNAIDKLNAIREVTMALARDPTAAFAKTYAQWGWPLGAIFGAIAQAATYASLIAGLASIRKMAQGGVVSGGTPGRDSVLTSLTPGELVTPAGNFDEVVGAVAAARDQDTEHGQEVTLRVELDGEVLASAVTELQKRNRAYG